MGSLQNKKMKKLILMHIEGNPSLNYSKLIFLSNETFFRTEELKTI